MLFVNLFRVFTRWIYEEIRTRGKSPRHFCSTICY